MLTSLSWTPFGFCKKVNPFRSKKGIMNSVRIALLSALFHLRRRIMRLICEATQLNEFEVERLSSVLTGINCEHEKTDTSIIVDYDGPMNQHALAIITAVEAYGCHRVVMTR